MIVKHASIAALCLSIRLPPVVRNGLFKTPKAFNLALTVSCLALLRFFKSFILGVSIELRVFLDFQRSLHRQLQAVLPSALMPVHLASQTSSCRFLLQERVHLPTRFCCGELPQQFCMSVRLCCTSVSTIWSKGTFLVPKCENGHHQQKLHKAPCSSPNHQRAIRSVQS